MKTYENYRYNVQRADSIRYFLLAEFGGTYIDLDDVSRTPSIHVAAEALMTTGLQATTRSAPSVRRLDARSVHQRGLLQPRHGDLTRPPLLQTRR
ncbi:hypothetical protein HC762_01430 [bacterium]|nr:hypothetical protein [bacterium]